MAKQAPNPTITPPPKTVPDNEEEEEEEDYMSMTITEPPKPTTVKETYTQLRLRKEREAEIRGRTKSKRELEAEAVAGREAALSKSLLSDSNAASNKGLKMMAKMGFTPGATLGKKAEGGDSNGNANGVRRGLLDPLMVSMKEDRGGIGMDTEKKRKFREEVEGEAKRVKAEEGDYRERVRREREEVRLEGLLGAAMRVAERMSDEKEERQQQQQDETINESGADINEGVKARTISTKPLKQINILWRALVRKREEKERDRRMRYDLHQSLSRLPTYEDPTEDQDDKIALGKGGSSRSTRTALVEDLEEEDPELDAFNELPSAERLQKLVQYLRDEHFYCFWCKHAYPDKEMEGCPGITEEDHD